MATKTTGTTTKNNNSNTTDSENLEADAGATTGIEIPLVSPDDDDTTRTQSSPPPTTPPPAAKMTMTKEDSNQIYSLFTRKVHDSSSGEESVEMDVDDQPDYDDDESPPPMAPDSPLPVPPTETPAATPPKDDDDITVPTANTPSKNDHDVVVEEEEKTPIIPKSKNGNDTPTTEPSDSPLYSPDSVDVEGQEPCQEQPLTTSGIKLDLQSRFDNNDDDDDKKKKETTGDDKPVQDDDDKVMDDPERVGFLRRRRLYCFIMFSCLVIAAVIGVTVYFVLQRQKTLGLTQSNSNTVPPTNINENQEAVDGGTAAAPSAVPDGTTGSGSGNTPPTTPGNTPTTPTASPTAPLPVPIPADPTPPPTPSPTQAPTASPRQVIMDVLEAQTGLDLSTEDPYSPHSLALDWLVAQSEIDGMTISAGSNATWSLLEEPTKLVQRFALLSMEFSLRGTPDESTQAPVMNNDTMTNGTMTNGTMTNGTMTNDTFFNVRALEGAESTALQARWDWDECDWYGVTCDAEDDEGIVTELRLKGMNLQGTIPATIQFLPNLRYFDVSTNQLQGSIPDELWGLSQIQSLYLYQNRLTGTISDKIGDLQNLTHIHFSHNQLVGTLPLTMKSKDDIKPYSYINLFRNQLSGTIPENLRWRQLFYLDLGQNDFTGTLPYDLGEKFVALRHLHLDHNRFNGTLPDSYINVGNARIESISIQANLLTGDLPGNHDFGNKLVQYQLFDNDFASMDKTTCKMSVFDSGEMIEFKADCEICQCGAPLCNFCVP